MFMYMYVAVCHTQTMNVNNEESDWNFLASLCCLQQNLLLYFMFLSFANICAVVFHTKNLFLEVSTKLFLQQIKGHAYDVLY